MNGAPDQATRSAAALLELSNIEKSLGTREVLLDVNLHVRAGELVVLLGPNGAGKTTLLGTACGRIAADAGLVALSGADPRRTRSARSTLGFVPQQLALYPYLTVVENLQVFGRLMGVPKNLLSERAEEALSWSGLVDRANDRVDTLSGGMQRRLNIVASLMHGPSLLMLDEPTVGVDVNARERIHELLRRLRTEGLGILLTTHDLHQATILADRVVFLIAGRIRLEGAPEALIESVFGNSKEMTITLTSLPDDRQRAQLSGHGLVPVHGGRTWAGSVPEGYAGVSEWNNKLSEFDLSAAEIRVREPSLEGVFQSLTGEELRL
ncbi:MAG: ABC transporter ATP-binding protein [Pseudomonadales bacterium]